MQSLQKRPVSKSSQLQETQSKRMLGLSYGVFLALAAGVFLSSKPVRAAGPEAIAELRLSRFTQLFKADFDRQLELPSTQLKGALQNPTLKVVASEWGFEKNSWVIRGLKLSLSSPLWSYEESSLLKLECRDIQAEWDLSGSLLRPEQMARLSLELKFSSGQPPTEGAAPDVIAFSQEIRGLLEEALSPHFKQGALDNRFHLKASCPSNMQKILQGILRAWLVDWPQKERAEFEKFLDAFQEQLGSIPLKKIGVLEKIPRELIEAPSSATLKLKVFEGASENLMRLVLLRGNEEASVAAVGIEERLGTKAKTLLNEARPQGATAELLLSPKSLNEIAALAVHQIPTRGLVSRSTQYSLRVDTGNTVNLQDFMGLLPELKEHENELSQMGLRVVFEDCAGNPAPPALKPFVTASGLNALDLEWQASLEFLNPRSGELLVKRHLESFVLSASFVRSSNTFAPRFLGGRVLVNKIPANDCQITPFPAEFLLTVDWLFQSAGIRKTVNEDLFSRFKYEPSSKLHMRQVGEASMSSARNGGGFFSEALVLGAEFK